MKLFNSLSGEKEEFKPIKNREVGLYTCGPTVYDLIHIGNCRAFVFNDLLKRVLLANDFKVQHVMNITDVDDKTIKKSEGDRAKFDKLTRDFEDKVWQDLAELNILKPDVVTRATEYIDQIVAFVRDLMDKGFAYKAADGSIYFSIAKFADYGKLSRLDQREVKTGARVAQDDYTKENPADFALWKAWDASDGEVFWESELGKGRPGWHIECSAMSQDVLGDTIDIHTGGIDLLFPHHENEIAQSEARTGKKFVNFWVHNEHLLVDGKKMSKSLNNFYTLEDIRAKGFDPLDFRYFALGAHYRSKLNFTWEAMEGARNARERMKRIVAELPRDGGSVDNVYLARFKELVSNDLNVPEGLAIFWELLRDDQLKKNDKWATVLEFDDVLGLRIDEIPKIDLPKNVVDLAEMRKQARREGDYKKSDEIRQEISSLGWRVDDLPGDEYILIKVQWVS